ncbi:MAG TPA: enoyl-CoA hydratase-related protein [Acidimicrobiia bacterium]|nr:enoyl-CoA hydratase-related protein [Acidimicrobiia bacterium]
MAVTNSVLYETDGRVAWIVFNRPETRNAITGEEMLEELVGAIGRADADPSIGVLTMTGAGTAFSAGGNVKDMADRRGLFSGSPDEITEGYRRSIQTLTRIMLATDLATIASVNGPAVGAGFDLALTCDLRLGSENARFAHTFVDLGIIPGDGGAWLLPRVVGWQRASELAFTGRMVGAEEAVSLGILLEVVPATELAVRTRALAELIASKPPTSVRFAKRLLRHARQMDLDGFLDLSAALQAIAHHTDEHPRAVADYLLNLERSRRSAPAS